MTVGLGFRENRLTSFPPIAGKWRPTTYSGIVKPAPFERLAALPAKPTAAAVLEAAAIFDEFVADWRARKGVVYWSYHGDNARWDLDEALALDTTEREVPGLRWILDLWERLGGAGRYTSHAMQRPREPRYHVEPTPEAIADLADRLNLAPKNEVERAILTCQFERMSLSLRVRLAPMLEL